MKKKIMLLIICLLLAITFSGCSGGSSGNKVLDAITLTISGPSGTVTKTFAEELINHRGSAVPNMISYVNAYNYSFIQFQSGEMGTQGSMALSIVLYDNLPKSYATGISGISSPSGYIDYSFYNTLDNRYELYSSMHSNESGTITLSSIGDIGEKISGTFEVPVTKPSNTSETLRISGSFSVTKINPVNYPPYN